MTIREIRGSVFPWCLGSKDLAGMERLEELGDRQDGQVTIFITAAAGIDAKGAFDLEARLVKEGAVRGRTEVDRG